MRTLSPREFLDILRGPACLNHHLTGPPCCQQPEGQGSVSHTEGQVLAALAFRLGGPVLEIGADLGISSRYIHEGLDQHAGPFSIVSVDYNHKWPEDPAWPRRIRVDADTRGRPHPLVLKMAPYTWAFIDGDHRAEGVLADIDLALPLTRILVFHDTRLGQPKPTNPSNGSEAREVVLECFGDEGLIEVTSECGLMIWGLDL